MSTTDARRDATGIQVTVTEGERCQRSIDVTASAEFLARERNAVLKEYALRVKLPGFRKGRVPLATVERRCGADIDSEVKNRVFDKARDQALASTGLKPIADIRVSDYRVSKSDGLSFTMSFEIVPEFRLDRIGGFRVERPAVTVPDNAVDAIVERFRREHAIWRTENAGQPEAGDSVTVRLTELEKVEGENGDDGTRDYDIVLGNDEALPAIETAIRTLAVGEANEFDIEFPEDHPDEERAGSSHRLMIELVSRRVQELPEEDDALAAAIGGFEDMNALRADIAKWVERDVRSRAESEFQRRLLDLIVEANPFDVPETMVDSYTEDVLCNNFGHTGNLESEEVKELASQLAPVSEQAVKRDLVARRIVREHGLRASREEVGARIEELAHTAGESPSAFRAALRESGGLEKLEYDLTSAKLLGFLAAQSNIAAS